MKKYLLLIFLFTLGMTAYSQENEEEEIENEDIIELDLDDEELDDDFLELSAGFNFNLSPYAHLSAGIATPTYKGHSFENLDHFKLILGFSKFSDDVVKGKDKNVKGTIRELSTYGLLIESYDYNTNILTEETTKDQFGFYKFGYSSSEGYGYILGENSDIILGQETSFGWQSINYNYGSLADSMIIILPAPFNEEKAASNSLKRRYGDDVRFSQSFETFVKVRPIKNLSLDFGYQRDLIFPRYMIWHAMASGITEGVLEQISKYFVRKVKKVSPYAAPIVSFILQNGISYAFTELRKDNMNWPIKGEQPLIINSMNFGINYHF